MAGPVPAINVFDSAQPSCGEGNPV